MLNGINNTFSFFRVLLVGTVLSISSSANAQFVEEMTKNLYVPNVFSPNGDEFNQIFLPVFSDPQLVTEYKLVIYNRKGEIIYESLDFRQGWDGSQFGREAQPGTYTWTVEFRYSDEENSQLISGHVNVWR